MKDPIVASILRWMFDLFKSSSTALEADQAIAPSQMIFEELESRMLFSVEPVSGLLNIPDLLEQQSFDSIPVETLLIDSESQKTSITVDAEIRNELIFIDETVTDSDQLINDLISNESDTKNFTVIVLESEKNGIDQITEELLKYQRLDAVHIISHGTQGTVTLGSTQLSLGNLNNYSASISQWQNSFDLEADLLIYGCELAGNSAGKALTTELSVLTGTDVAASIDDTGIVSKGGDWELEFSTGAVETSIAFSNQVQKSWNGVLAFETYRDEFNAISYSGSDGSQNWTGASWQEIGESDGVNLGQVIVSSELGEQGLVINQSNNGALREVDLSGATSASLSFEYARIELDSASESIVLEISDDGGGSWTLLDTWVGSANDSSMLYASYDISDYIATDTQVRFVATGLDGGKFFIDNTQIAFNENFSGKSEFLVNSSNANSQETSSQNRGSHQSVAVASNGDYVVVWTEVKNTGTLSDVFAQQFNADGSVKTPTFKVNTFSAKEQQWASVASDASGRFVVSWTSQNQDGDGQGIYLKRFNSDGTTIDGIDILVNAGNTTGNQTNSSIAINSPGEMVITWQSDEPGKEGIFAKRFDLTTVVVGNQLPTSTIMVNSGSSRANPSADINSEGKFVISWGQGTDVYAQRFSADGTSRGSSTKVNTLSSGFGVVSIQESGDFFVAYQSNQPLFEGVWVRHYNDDGSDKASSTKVSSGRGANHSAPSITKDLKGNIIIVYEGTGDGDAQGVFARKYDSDRNALSAEFQINETTSGNQQMASIAMLDLGNYVVVWSGNGTDDANGVYARQFAVANSSPIADANAGSPYVITEGASINLDGSSSSDPDGNVLNFLWDLNNDGSYGDVVGENPTIDWVTLQSFGINDNDVYTIGLQVNDGKGGTNNTTTTITVNKSPPALITTGSATVEQGMVYTLNLTAIDSGADTISSWIINWGDGAIETFVGNPASATHIYTNSGFTYNILASATDEDGTYLQNQLLIPDFSRDSILRFAPTTGAIVNEFATDNGITAPVDVKIGPDGLLYVSSEVSNNVLRYNAATGAFIDSFVTAGNVEGIAFGPDGNLYVADWGGKVIRYDITDGSYIDDFVTSGLGGLSQAYGIVFGPDGNLYVSSYDNHNVLRYDGGTGAFIDEFVSSRAGGLENPEEMLFGSDGHLFISSLQTNNVLRYGSTGVFIDIFIAANSGGLDSPAGLAFGPDGHLYVADYKDGAIIRYDGSTGAYFDQYVTAGTGGLAKPVFLEFLPQQQVTVSTSVNNTPTTNGLANITVAEDSADSVIDLLTAFTDVEDLDSDLIYSIQSNSNTGLFTASTLDAATNTLTLGFALNQIGSSDITIRATDSDGEFVDATFTVTVNAVNDAPTTGGLVDITVTEDSADSVIDLLTAFTDVEDLDNDLIYSIQSNTNAGLFTASTLDAASNTLTLNYAPNKSGSSDITIRATDSGGEIVDTTFIVTVNAVNDTPITSGLADITVTEDSTDSIIDLLTVFTDVEDLDSDLSYSIQSNTNTGLFTASTLDSATNTLTLGYALNQIGSSDITIRAADSGGEFVDATFTVTVNAVNDAPTTNGLANITVAEDSADSIIDLLTVFTDVEDLDSDLSYSIQSNTNTGLFTASTLDAATNTLTLGYALNQIGSSDITIRATDSGGEFVDATFTATVNAVNNNPTTSGLANVSVDEDAAETVINLFAGFADTEDSDTVLTYTLSSNTNAGLFSTTAIDGMAGTLSLEYAPNQNGSADITVRATDSNGLFVETLFTVTVNAINDSPTLSNFTGIVENTNEDNEIEITFSELIAQGDEYDVDGDVDGFIVKVLSSGNLRIGADVGSATPWNATTNNLINNGNHAYWTPDLDSDGTQNAFELVVKDNLNAESSTNVMVQVEVIAVNNAPSIEDQTFSIAENSLEGTLVGKVTANDRDLADTLSLSIIGENNNAFSINPSTGEISVTDSTQLDFENIPSYSMTVQVTDNGVKNLSETATITINLTDINESPDSIALTNTHIDENTETSSGYAVGSLNATDEDAVDSFTYTISGGADQLNFSIGGIGNNELIINNGILIFENKSSYEVIVRVTDSMGLSHDETFTVIVHPLTNSVGVIDKETEINQGLGDLFLKDFLFGDANLSNNEEVTNSEQGLSDLQPTFVTPVSTDLNQEDNTIGVGDKEIETDGNKAGILTIQNIFSLMEGEKIVQGTINAPVSMITEHNIHRHLIHKELPHKVRVKSNIPDSKNVIETEFSIVAPDNYSLQSLFDNAGFTDGLDSLREQVQEDINVKKMIVGSSLSVTTGLSVGYVIWLIRGGVLLSSVLSSLPAWRMIDPLPIMGHLKGYTENDEDDDSLESLVNKDKKVVKSKTHLKLNSVADE